MYKFELFEEMSEEIARAVNLAVSKYGFGHHNEPLVVYALMDFMGSPLKSLLSKGPLARDVGMKGFDAFMASRIAAAVEVLKSPSSLIVNPMMDAIAAAVARHDGPTPDNLLFRNTLRVFLQRPRLSLAGVPAALRKNGSLQSAFGSACGYLQQGGVIARISDGTAWELSI